MRLPGPFVLLERIRPDLAWYGENLNVRHVQNLLNEIPANDPLHIRKPVQVKRRAALVLRKWDEEQSQSMVAATTVDGSDVNDINAGGPAVAEEVMENEGTIQVPASQQGRLESDTNRPDWRIFRDTGTATYDEDDDVREDASMAGDQASDDDIEKDHDGDITMSDAVEMEEVFNEIPEDAVASSHLASAVASALHIETPACSISTDQQIIEIISGDDDDISSGPQVIEIISSDDDDDDSIYYLTPKLRKRALAEKQAFEEEPTAAASRKRPISGVDPSSSPKENPSIRRQKCTVDTSTDAVEEHSPFMGHNVDPRLFDDEMLVDDAEAPNQPDDANSQHEQTSHVDETPERTDEEEAAMNEEEQYEEEHDIVDNGLLRQDDSDEDVYDLDADEEADEDADEDEDADQDADEDVPGDDDDDDVDARRNGRYYRRIGNRPPQQRGPAVPNDPDLIMDHISTTFSIPRETLACLADGAIPCSPYGAKLALDDLVNFLPKRHIDARIMDAYFSIFNVLFPYVHCMACEEAASILKPCYNGSDRRARSNLLVSFLPDDAAKIIFPLARANGWTLIFIDATGEEEIFVRPLVGYQKTGWKNVSRLTKLLSGFINMVAEDKDQQNMLTSKFVYNMTPSQISERHDIPGRYLASKKGDSFLFLALLLEHVLSDSPFKLRIEIEDRLDAMRRQMVENLLVLVRTKGSMGARYQTPIFHCP